MLINNTLEYYLLLCQLIRDLKYRDLNKIHTYKMEYNKINNLLLSEDNESETLSKFVTREYVRVNSLLDTHNENKSIGFKTPMLRSNLCDYSDAYILVKGTITVTVPGDNNDANNIRGKKIDH